MVYLLFVRLYKTNIILKKNIFTNNFSIFKGRTIIDIISAIVLSLVDYTCQELLDTSRLKLATGSYVLQLSTTWTNGYGMDIEYTWIL